MKQALTELLTRLLRVQKVELYTVEVDVNAPLPLRFPAAERTPTGIRVVHALLAGDIWRRSWAHIVADALYVVHKGIPVELREQLLVGQRRVPMLPRLLDPGTFERIVAEEHTEDGWVNCWTTLDTAWTLDAHALQPFLFAPLPQDERRLYWEEPENATTAPALVRLEEDVSHWADKLYSA